MAAPPIRIRIGASVDSSVEREFSNVEKRAKKSKDRIQKDSDKASEALKKSAESTASKEIKEKERVSRAAERESQKQARAAEKAAEKVARDAQKSADKQIQAAERASAKIIKEQERAAKSAERASQRAQRQFAERTSHRATRFLMPNAPIGSMAMRGLGGAVRGMGVDANISTMFSRLGDQEKMAVNLSNAGYLPNAEEGNANRVRVDPDEIRKQTSGITAKYGISGEESLGAIGEYTKIAGDLNAARLALDGLAKLSLATGTNLADMAAAAGNVDMQLGKIPNKAKIVDDIMRTIAAQGKMGGVEIADFAVQMARVASAANKFEGDTGENIKKFGALAQIARGTGGAPSAAEASRSVVGFTNTLKKGARLKEFDALDIDVYNEKNQMRDPFKIIEESLVKTNGDPRKMNKLFMDVVGERAIGGLSSTFNRAGGNEGGGVAAVREQLAKFVESASISNAELEESAKRASETTAAKAEKFNGELLEMTERIRGKLIPALDKNSDKIIKFAEIIGSIATWAIENPKLAIAGAITASIARAGIESALRSGIESVIGASGGGMGVGGYTRTAGFMGGAGVVGNLAAGATIASLGVTTLVVGTAIIDHLFNEAQEEQRKDSKQYTAALNAGSDAKNKWEAGDYDGGLVAQKKSVAGLEKSLATNQEKAPTLVGTALNGLLSMDNPVTRFVGAGEGFDGNAAVRNKIIVDQQKDLKEQTAVLKQMLSAIEQMKTLEMPGEVEQ